MDAAEGLLVGDVVHQDEAHGAPVVGRRDGAVPLLAGRVLQAEKSTFYFPFPKGKILLFSRPKSKYVVTAFFRRRRNMCLGFHCGLALSMASRASSSVVKKVSLQQRLSVCRRLAVAPKVPAATGALTLL